MLFKIFKFIFYPPLNFALSRSLRPFHRFIPVRFQFPVNGEFRIQIGDHQHILFTTNYTCYLSRLLFWQGMKGFEYNSVILFLELLREAKVFMDIGANVGYYSLLAAAQNKNVRVIAFEPLPDAITFFKKNIALNGFTNIEVEPLALADKEGEMNFYYPICADFPDLKFQLAGDGSLVNYDNLLWKEITVKTSSLDHYVKSNTISQIDLIKIDTETTEYLIFENGRNVLSQHRPIILCEVLKGYNENKLEQILKQEQYLFYEVSNDGLIAIPTLTEIKNYKNDFLMIPIEKIELIKTFLKY